MQASDTLQQAAWEHLLRLAKHPGASGAGEAAEAVSEQLASTQLWQLFFPLCAPAAPLRFGCFTAAHLGQSLDAKISPPSGLPEAITSREDMRLNHQMRALFDVVLVGAGTVFYDDPQLTVREAVGVNPVRVVVDPERRLGANYRVFQDGAAPTLLLCKEVHLPRGARHGQAEVVGVPGECRPGEVLQALAARGCPRVFIEGGGVTVSRFLQAGALHVLQLAVSPLIMGQGRPGIALTETVRLRPQVSKFSIGEDTLFQCTFGAQPEK